MIAAFTPETARRLLDLLSRSTPDRHQGNHTNQTPVIVTAGLPLTGGPTGYKIHGCTAYRLARAIGQTGANQIVEVPLEADPATMWLLSTTGLPLQPGVEYLAWQGPDFSISSVDTRIVWLTEGRSLIQVVRPTGSPSAGSRLYRGVVEWYDSTTDELISGEEVWLRSINGG